MNRYILHTYIFRGYENSNNLSLKLSASCTKFVLKDIVTNAFRRPLPTAFWSFYALKTII